MGGKSDAHETTGVKEPIAPGFAAEEFREWTDQVERELDEKFNELFKF